MSEIERLRLLDTCAVSDALDTLGLPGAVIGIHPLRQAPTPIAGRVRTVTAGPATPGVQAAHIAASAVDAGTPDDVLVIANDAQIDVSCWGGILTRAAVRHGIAGVVIDGACRDIAESEELGLPVYGRAVVPVSARRRIVQLATGETIDIAGVTVHEADLALADRNGVTFVATESAEAVLALAKRIVAREAAMTAAVEAGELVASVMHDTMFPTLEEM